MQGACRRAAVERDPRAFISRCERRTCKTHGRTPRRSPIGTRCRACCRSTRSFSTSRKYYNGYLLHPYVSWYTGRGCTAKCTFCLWPHTIGGHIFRHKSPEAVGRDLDEAKASSVRQVREYMFDDDTLTNEKDYAIALSKHMKRLNLSWACNARAHVDYDTLKTLRDNGLRVLLVGFESGNQEILLPHQKGSEARDGARVHEELPQARHQGARHVHHRLAGRDAGNRARDDRVRQGTRPAHDSGFDRLAVPGHGALRSGAGKRLVCARRLGLRRTGIQTSTLRYDTLSTAEIEDSVERMYREFYFRPKKIAKIVAEMVTSRQMMVRRLARRRRVLRLLAGAASAGRRTPGRSDSLLRLRVRPCRAAGRTRASRRACCVGIRSCRGRAGTLRRLGVR